MTFLIDTHTFLWFIAGSDELSETAKEVIENDNNDIFISIASLWEISIKTAIGKLQILESYDTVINDVTENEMSILSINFTHTVIQNKLPFHHKDPFDRIIVSQAIAENLSLISRDDIFDVYLKDKGIKRIW
ncbi:MAG: type II toxin-antitoxin system VapC family toxin [Candidatus Parabeggiatoa sp. nov. 3]|jgi:PIN domain nuclease of toxin-antitoxin system|nr:MAG: type II toxin-antitoxin system VapC family toxin [Gammaproteobacteria bacterium]RKZ56578.1 MAG: type II toxin-antitoxin system VapC family toxin [Gammaproteobacteria bacterium]RKZ77806.1 MAG: type II toxin-antitoxin system VapC family toxin [Gammaproteobacteria bacterium]